VDTFQKRTTGEEPELAVARVWPSGEKARKLAELSKRRSKCPEVASNSFVALPAAARYLPSGEKASVFSEFRQRRLPNRATAPIGNGSLWSSLAFNVSGVFFS
jgi:hypothetical protein